jgi:hypothetical protein
MRGETVIEKFSGSANYNDRGRCLFEFLKINSYMLDPLIYLTLAIGKHLSSIQLSFHGLLYVLKWKLAEG